MSEESVLDTSYIQCNREQLERLRALVDRLSDEELRQPVSGEWTVAVTLAHLAYWDTRGVGALEAALRHTQFQFSQLPCLGV